ncbi:hypothetical protein UFOVP833_44 [uncultured Caudovirales phage]|uniref:Uncharacterized protein n=1 Tax=uncultured Caudovirales phage TaxID=2100421 RepID=A0A6J5P0F3_9CAUD|nr:hypothetical protein UFOVP833_44 [uncultured Caudovirales phage]CAB4218636.1 hypothetical protein UFOVP1603_44 [uncultured Caudovirales phage]
MLVVLTEAEAAVVRGKSGPMAEIMPIPLKDGTFILGTEVFDDPAHTNRVGWLKGRPECEWKDIEALIPEPPKFGIKG